MATLHPGEPARMYALGKVARGGATRGGYVSALAFIAVGGVPYGVGAVRGPGHVGALITSLSITDELNDTPNTCQFTINGAVPTAGAPVRVTLGSVNSGTPLFAGYALTVHQRYVGQRPANVQADVSCVDYTWLFSSVLVTAVYTTQSASAIAADLVAKYMASHGFTGGGIAPGLPVVDVITYTNEELDQAMSRLAQRIGAYWYVGYDQVIHLFITETTNGDPEPLTPHHRSLADFAKLADRTQLLTRVYVEGRGTTIMGDVAAGDTKIPVQAIDMFQVAPDVYAKVSPHASDGGAQHLTFTGIVPGGAGSLVGPGIGPPAAPTVGRAAGAGLATGHYQYAYTFRTASGESLPSPLAAIDVGGPITGPTTPPTLTPTPGSGVDPGAHTYGYNYITAAGGETVGGTNSASCQTQAPLTPSGGISGVGVQQGGTLPQNTYFGYAVTYIGNAGGETTQATAGASVNTGLNNAVRVGIGGGGIYTIPAGVARVNVYRSPGAPDSRYYNGPFYYIGSVAYSGSGAVTFDDTGYALGAPIPTTNTAQVRLGAVQVVTPASPDPAVTGVKIYRTTIGGVWGLVAQVSGANGAVTYTDTTPDANLGAAPPSLDTSGNGYSAVAVGNIATGPAAVTARWLYRTTVGGSQLRWVGGIAAGASTFTDTVADASLGGNAPTADTSQLAQTPGQVPAGAGSLPVANPLAFESGGGWAVIGNGEQTIRYAGQSGNALIGIPAAGIGAIVAAVAYGSTVTASPMLIGIPTAGPYALAAGLNVGDDVNVYVQRDDTQRQSDFAAMIGSQPGIREAWVQDRRLSIAEARADGDATLKTRPLEAVTVTYRCRDLRTASGKTIIVNLPAPTNVAGSYKIQRVTIGNFRPFPTQYPTFTVTASDRVFSFEDWLRRMETSV